MVKKKADLKKTYEVSYKASGSNGFSSTRAMNFDDNVKYFKPVEGRNKINIIPYEIKTENHPLVAKGSLEVGDSDYKLDLWEHRGLGLDGRDSCVCLKKNYGKPCPICEEYERLKKLEDENADTFKPKRREYYNVLNKDNELQVFATSHYLFGKELIEEARDDEEGGFIDFADTEEGKAVKFRASKTSFGGADFFEYKSFSFEDREEPISDKILDKVISLDELINVPTYEELHKLVTGEVDDEEDDEDEEEEAPPKKTETTSSRKSATFDEDEEPSKPVRKSECPFGHKFGKDCDAFDDCDNCDCWERCYKTK